MFSSFRSRFPTDLCLIYLTDFITFKIDKGDYSGIVLLDLQKAFDTVGHNILLVKLEAKGLNGDVIRWFFSHLVDRHYLVDVSHQVLK